VSGATYLYARGRARLTAWAPEHAGLCLGDLLAQVDAAFTQVRRGVLPVRAPHLRHRRVERRLS